MAKKTKPAPPQPAGDKPAPSAAEMRALIQAEQQRRIAECQRLIQIALDTTRCTLDVKMVITTLGNLPEVTITAND